VLIIQEPNGLPPRSLDALFFPAADRANGTIDLSRATYISDRRRYVIQLTLRREIERAEAPARQVVSASNGLLIGFAADRARGKTIGIASSGKKTEKEERKKERKKEFIVTSLKKAKVEESPRVRRQ
jgi:hypothetical protein